MVSKKSNKLSTKAAAKQAVKATSFSTGQVITLAKEAAANSGFKRPGSGAAELWAQYGKGNITVGEYLKRCAVLKGPNSRPKAGRVALKWDYEHEYIFVK